MSSASSLIPLLLFAAVLSPTTSARRQRQPRRAAPHSTAQFLHPQLSARQKLNLHRNRKLVRDTRRELIMRAASKRRREALPSHGFNSNAGERSSSLTSECGRDASAVCFFFYCCSFTFSFRMGVCSSPPSVCAAATHCCSSFRGAQC